VDQHHGAGARERDDDADLGIGQREIGVPVASMDRLAEAKAQERLDRTEEGQDDERVEPEIAENTGDHVHETQPSRSVLQVDDDEVPVGCAPGRSVTNAVHVTGMTCPASGAQRAD
jgi:hypothetical protein